MILLLDIGNTRVKWGWLHDDRVVGGGAVVHAGDVEQVLTGWTETSPPRRVVAVCVAGTKAVQRVQQWVQAHWSVDIEFIRATPEAAGVANGYANPAQLGADRWVAAIGAYARSRTAVCVADCGSAVTLDTVDASGRHRGGLIIPGLRLMRRALHQGTADLPMVDERPLELFGRDTSTAIASGTLLAVAAAVDQIAVRMASDCGGDTQLWLTGGDAATLLPHLAAPFRHDPDLVLHGLAAVTRAVPSPRFID